MIIGERCIIMGSGGKTNKAKKAPMTPSEAFPTAMF